MTLKRESIFNYADNFSLLRDIKTEEILRGRIGAPLITVVIPTYKRVDTLEETIDSAINQVGCDNYDIIVLDNNPERNDETEALMFRKYVSEPKLSYYKNSQNLGMTGNWNRGVELCRGQYMLLLHDDDYISNIFIAQVNIILAKYNVDLLKTRQVLWRVNEKMPRPSIDDKQIDKEPCCNRAELGMVLNSFGNYWIPSGVILRKSVVIDSGGFNDYYYPAQDYALFAKLIVDHNAYLYMGNELFVYRIEKNTQFKIESKIKYLEVEDIIRQDICKRMHLSSFLSDTICKIHYMKSYYSIKQKDPQFVAIRNNKRVRRPRRLDVIICRLFCKIYNYYWYRDLK